jgi:hypothetical protein
VENAFDSRLLVVLVAFEVCVEAPRETEEDMSDVPPDS